MTAEPLKPLDNCPFCGGNVGIGRIGHQWDTDPCFIVCDGCNMVFEITEHSHSIEEITAAWNRREPLGNSDELPDYIKQGCLEEIQRLFEFSTDPSNYVNDRIRCEVRADAIRWVLSLKKE